MTARVQRLRKTLPFANYPSPGRALLGRPKGDLARRGCARDVLAWCAWREHDASGTLESEPLADFAAHFGGLPFANINA
jgi:hypothetical protein